MPPAGHICAAGPAHHSAIDALYPRAFPDEDLRPLVTGLLRLDGVLSCVYVADSVVLGHIAFTPCGTDRRDALLGPLAVDPGMHGQGIGTRLIRHGLAQLASEGTRQVFVLGAPDYYGRFGFKAERHSAPPYPLPDASAGAWQSLYLTHPAKSPCARLTVPDIWMKPELW